MSESYTYTAHYVRNVTVGEYKSRRAVRDATATRVTTSRPTPLVTYHRASSIKHGTQSHRCSLYSYLARQLIKTTSSILVEVETSTGALSILVN